MNLFQLDRTIKHYNNFNDLDSIKIVLFYKDKRKELIKRINKKLHNDNLPLIK